MFKLFGLFLIFSLASAKHEFYKGFSLYEVTVKDVEQIKIVNELEVKLNADVWIHAVPGRKGEIMVSKENQNEFEDTLAKAGVQYNKSVENVKDILDIEDQLLEQAKRKSSNVTKTGALPMDRTYSYEEVNEYLQYLAQTYPNTVKLVLAGFSFEGRAIRYLKISTTNFEDLSKPVIYMESLIHAREWVTLPVTLYAIEKLVIDVQDQELLQGIDWIILPIANPDGYSHTDGDLGMRLWRKNRATGYIIGDVCVGVDLNRNFDVNWSAHSSNIPCSDTFHGRNAFSEPETAVINNIVIEHKDRMKMFLDIHSFGSYILYGFGNGSLPTNGLILHLVGIQMANAIDNAKMWWNRDYTVGNVALVLYEASGSAQDYAQYIGVPLGYTFELPGYRFGFGTGAGFFVDPNFIEQVGYETWEGIKVGARYVLANYKKNN